MTIDYNDPTSLDCDTFGATHWSSRPLAPAMTLVERISAASIGAQPQEFGSSYWTFSARFDELRLDEAIKFATHISKNRGLKPYLFYDRFRPYPSCVMNLPHQLRANAVKALHVTGLSKEEKAVTVTGTEGDLITAGDPFAFILNNKRIYNRALETVELTGAEQAIEVDLRPRTTETGLSIVVERVRPCAAFALNMKTYKEPRGNKLKDAFIEGVEWTGELA